MIPGEIPGAGMSTKLGGREEKAPRELAGGIGVFSFLMFMRTYMKSHSGRSVKEGKRWRKGLSPHAIVGRAWSGVAKSLRDGLVSSSAMWRHEQGIVIGKKEKSPTPTHSRRDPDETELKTDNFVSVGWKTLPHGNVSCCSVAAKTTPGAASTGASTLPKPSPRLPYRSRRRTRYQGLFLLPFATD